MCVIPESFLTEIIKRWRVVRLEAEQEPWNFMGSHVRMHSFHISLKNKNKKTFMFEDRRDEADNVV